MKQTSDVPPQATQPTGGVPRLSVGVKLSFGVGQIAEGLKTSVFGTFLLFYYNQVLGLAGDLAGIAIFVALIFDAVTDPIAGSVSDRWQSPGGRRHPFMYASALPLGASFALLFAPQFLFGAEAVAAWSQLVLFAWMTICTIMTRASMTLYHVPHMAVGAELSEDYDERTVLVAIRHFFGAVGFMLAYYFGYGLFFAPTDEFTNGQLNAAAYPPFAFTLALIMTLTIFITAFGTRSRIPYMPKARIDEAKVRVTDVFVETYEAMKNPSFRWIMYGFILIIAAWGMAGVTGIYVFTFFWELDRFQILFVSLMGPIGSMVGYPCARAYYSWLDKRLAMIYAGLFWMVVHAMPVLVYLAGFAPETNSWASAMFLAFFGALGGLGVGQIVVGIGSTMADIADENELHTGRRQEGVFFGASAFANKCSAGLGTLMAGFVLEWISWPTGSTIKTAADIPPETLLQLAVIAGPVIGVLAIPGVMCFRGYQLNRTRVREIQASLRAAA